MRVPYSKHAPESQGFNEGEERKLMMIFHPLGEATNQRIF